MAKEGVLLINHHKLKALIGAQVGLLTDAKIQRAAAAVDLGIKATPVSYTHLTLPTILRV